MKKFLVLLMMMICLSVNAQTAIETPKTFDNVYVGAQFGVSTPLSFDSFFPLNTSFGVKIGKNFTPVLGFNVEGNMWFGSATHDQGRFSYQNGIRATNVGVNATFDMFNWLSGYEANRVFTIIPEVGLGWLHSFNSHATDYNDLSAKTGVQFAWNVGNSKAWQLYAEPTIWWNLTGSQGVQFNSNYSQLGIQLGFIYKFKNSNGTHNFVVYDIEEMNENINTLRAELASAKETVKALENVEPIIVHDTITTERILPTISYAAPYYVCFAQNSSELTSDAKKVLDGMPTGIIVSIEATASPEGTEEYNKNLSEKRANVVAQYLTNRGVRVSSSEGIGVPNEAANRVAIITVSQ